MYDFSEFTIAMAHINTEGANKSNLTSLKNELNKFFSDARCLQVLYTENTDKMFFGMSVIPVLPYDYISKTVKGVYNKFDRYYLEIDSKLLHLGLTAKELTAITLHEVGHIVNDVKASKELSDVLNVAINEDGVSYEKIEKSKIRKSDFINLSVQRSIRKMQSFFCKNQSEYIADEFVVDCGFGKPLESAYEKVIKNRDSLSNAENNKYKVSSLLWSLSIFKDLGHRRKFVIEELEAQKQIEGSKLMNNLYDDAIKNVSKSHVSPIQEGFLDKVKYSDISSYENDLYEFRVRIKHIDNETEAIDLIREINFRIELMTDYLKTDPGQRDMKKIDATINKYMMLRTELSKSPKYKDKVYGLYVNYPEVNSRYSGRL